MSVQQPLITWSFLDSVRNVGRLLIHRITMKSSRAVISCAVSHCAPNLPSMGDGSGRDSAFLASPLPSGDDGGPMGHTFCGNGNARGCGEPLSNTRGMYGKPPAAVSGGCIALGPHRTELQIISCDFSALSSICSSPGGVPVGMPSTNDAEEFGRQTGGHTEASAAAFAFAANNSETASFISCAVEMSGGGGNFDMMR